jgi:hypothetical protein
VPAVSFADLYRTGGRSSLNLFCTIFTLRWVLKIQNTLFMAESVIATLFDFVFPFAFVVKNVSFQKRDANIETIFRIAIASATFFEKKFVLPLKKEKPRYRGFSQPRAFVAQAKALT